MNGKCAYWCSLAAAMVAGGVIAMAAVDPKDPKAQPGGDKPAMSPQEQAMMEAWAKYATPG
ncbi:MAG: hypothetical protein JNJ48_05835, partial [Phycisphaerae bacterium]|nr:hypothetical protein [Phycisphaerae bacterium]